LFNHNLCNYASHAIDGEEEHVTGTLERYNNASTGCLTLLEIYWKFTKSPGNFLVQFASLRVCH